MDTLPIGGGYWLTVTRTEESQKIDDLPFLATCWSGTLQRYSPAKLMVPLLMEALVMPDMAHREKPLTLRACHLCTFNVAVIFWGEAICTIIHHDIHIETVNYLSILRILFWYKM